MQEARLTRERLAQFSKKFSGDKNSNNENEDEVDEVDRTLNATRNSDSFEAAEEGEPKERAFEQDLQGNQKAGSSTTAKNPMMIFNGQIMDDQEVVREVTIDDRDEGLSPSQKNSFIASISEKINQDSSMYDRETLIAEAHQKMTQKAAQNDTSLQNMMKSQKRQTTNKNTSLVSNTSSKKFLYNDNSSSSSLRHKKPAT